jgi:hypothetical protein
MLGAPDRRLAHERWCLIEAAYRGEPALLAVTTNRGNLNREDQSLGFGRRDGLAACAC